MRVNGDMYYGLVAEAYDLYLADVDFGDVPFYRSWVRTSGEPALEIGCGTGRVLLQLAARGQNVEGIDSSAEMLAICRRKAADRNVNVTLHEGDMSRMRLRARYRTIFCPASSFMFLTEPDAAARALRGFADHLLPGGHVLISLHLPKPDPAPLNDSDGWRLRRQATRQADGAVLRCHERGVMDPATQLHVSRMRNEVVKDGQVVLAEEHEMALRWWTPTQFVRMLRDAGFSEAWTVRAYADEPLRDDEVGEGGEFVAIGRKG